MTFRKNHCGIQVQFSLYLKGGWVGVGGSDGGFGVFFCCVSGKIIELVEVWSSFIMRGCESIATEPNGA